MFAKPATFAAICALFMAPPACAREAGASASGIATANVISPLTATAVAELDFGTVAVALAQGGTVIVRPGTAGAHYTGSARQACQSGPSCATPHPALFRVGGEAGRNYLVSVPVQAIARPDGGSGEGLPVDDLVVRSASRPTEGAVGRLGADGQDRFEIGGTIHIPAGAPPASYSATVAVVLTYG